MPVVQLADLHVHYTERGSGPPLLLLHGGLATAEMSWSPDVVERLSASYRVVMPDARGHGRTNNPAATLSYSQMADDVVALCAALSLTNPIVIGYSDGAQVAIELGLRHGGLARAMVLGGVVLGRSPSYDAMLAGMGFTQERGLDVDALRADLGDEYFAKMVTEPHLHWQALLSQIAPLWLEVPTYTDEQLATIGEPCLVICGDRDRASLDVAVRLSRALPKAELAVVPNSEHGAAAKPLFWTNVTDFLTRH